MSITTGSRSPLFGEPGVDRVLEILDDEFITIMRQVGALNIAQITRDNVTRA